MPRDDDYATRQPHLAMQRTMQHITQRTCHPPVGSRRVTITRPSWLGPHRGRWPRPARPVRPMGLRGAPARTLTLTLTKRAIEQLDRPRPAAPRAPIHLARRRHFGRRLGRRRRVLGCGEAGRLRPLSLLVRHQLAAPVAPVVLPVARGQALAVAPHRALLLLRLRVGGDGVEQLRDEGVARAAGAAVIGCGAAVAFWLGEAAGEGAVGDLDGEAERVVTTWRHRVAQLERDRALDLDKGAALVVDDKVARAPAVREAGVLLLDESGCDVWWRSDGGIRHPAVHVLCVGLDGRLVVCDVGVQRPAVHVLCVGLDDLRPARVLLRPARAAPPASEQARRTLRRENSGRNIADRALWYATLL
eukprot:scaffold45954_cov62-Phaeocystis_antarctica.AAC.3